MNTDGSNRRKLGFQATGAFDAGMGPRGLSWSPSGEQLGYTVSRR